MQSLNDAILLAKQSIDINQYANDVLERVGNSNKLVCPACGCGTHANKTSSFSIKGNRFKCFSCPAGGDILDLAALVNHLDSDDKLGQLKALEEYSHIPLLEGTQKPYRATKANMATNTQENAQSALNETSSENRAKDEARYIARMQQNISTPEIIAYLNERGISLEQAQEWHLGYDASKRRLVIPYEGSEYYHVDRDITGKASHKYTKPKGLKEPLFGMNMLEDAIAKTDEEYAAPLFIVEGQLDALAIKSLGYDVVALGGVGYNNLVNTLKDSHKKPLCITALDNDDAGNKANANLELQLTLAGIPAANAKTENGSIYGRCKDASEALSNDANSLKESLNTLLEDIKRNNEKLKAEAQEQALSSLGVQPGGLVIEDLTLAEMPTPTPTGFSSIDNALGGGLVPSLYILGAVSSLGKTTLCVQIADQIAQAGTPVMFVTIEQSAREIAAKSISRIMFTSSEGDRNKQATALEMTTSRRYKWGETKQAAYYRACEEYRSSIASNMWLMATQGQPTVEDVRKAAQLMQDKLGNTPIIFIDYLQLLKAENDRDSDKQATDKNVMALRQLARDLETSVIVISSLNRGSYTGSITLDSFKESGAIEYGADVLLGWQPYGRHEKCSLETNETKAKQQARIDLEKAKDAPVRACELLILKNRSGRTNNEGIPFVYHAMHNSIKECSHAEANRLKTC